jgi:hypothetical protein
MSQIQKCKKMQKRKKCKKKCPENTRNFGCFIENRAVAICRSIEKVSKMTPNDASVHTFKIPGHFRGFSGLSIGVKFRKKGVFDVFWKNFHFCVYRLEVDGPYFYMGRKSELRFFSKSAEHVFGFGSDFVLLLLENPSGRK